MCGFIGFTGGQTIAEKERIIAPMMQRIVHRGPDMGGHYADESIALGFRRLSILDLSENGAQPMKNENGNLILVFNGEIYNFQSLREELQKKGHTFHSNTDSEVLLYAYEEYGEKMVAKLRGMFAFVLWDKDNKKLLAARDPFGIKPFYHCHLEDGSWMFGSEIKSFLEHPNFEKRVNPNALRAYLSFQYPAGNSTFFDGVSCLPQGHYCVYQDGNLRTECYFDTEFCPDESLTFEQYVDEIDAAVHESVQAHRISDVKVGAFLSGGVDSSYITACLHPEHSFSVGFAEANFDESHHAEELSKHLNVNNVRQLLTPNECFAALSDIQYHMDQPQSNPSSVPLWFLAKLAAQKVTVVLSGEGADELFAGYELYADTPTMERFKKTPRKFRRLLGGVAKGLPAIKGRNFLLKSAEKPENWFIGQAVVFSEREAHDILQPAYQGGPSPHDLCHPFYRKAADLDEVSKKQYLDLHLWLPGDILLKADKMCMAHSLELRVPFLDKEIMALARRIPSRYRIRGSENKVVFRHAANRTLPDEWATRPKKGFPVPIRSWLRQKEYYEFVRRYFESDFAAAFFHKDKLMQLLNEHYEKRANRGRRIWTVLCFLIWYERFFILEEEKNAL